MNLSKIKKYIVIFCLVFSSLLGEQKSSFQSHIFIGYDSNPMRLSDGEISQLSTYPSILGNAEEIDSPFIGFKFKIKHNSLKNKLQFSFNLKGSYYNFSKDKNNYNFSFNIKKSFGNSKYFIFDYFLMPDFYLREYEDRDLYFICDDDLNNCLLSSHFSIEKIRMSLVFPVKQNKSSLKLSFLHERQIFDKHFTEFDLRIYGPVVEYKLKYNKYNFSLLFENLIADNYTYLDDSFSTMYMDRSYNQKRYKMAIEKKYHRKRKFGFVVDIFRRENTSLLQNDNLHYNRSHIDMTISYWHKINSNKVTISFRKRQTSSPYQWVRNLKTFKRVVVTYTKYFKIMKF